MNTTRHRSIERGAALVVAMVLLVILTLLAISGMNTATTELVMAGNEMYQENAFQAAETGIERTAATSAFNPATPPAAPPPTITLASGDRYAATVQPLGSSPPPPGYTIGEFSAENFEIRSTGMSLRNAQTEHVQGLFLIVPGAP
jgi:type IV pilus assembly protein PilX